MLSLELKYSPRLSEQGRDLLNQTWEAFIVAFPEAFLLDMESVELKVNTIYRTNWAAIWNEPSKVGERVGIMATNTDNTLAFVVFLDDPKMTGNIYRTVDLEPLELTYKQFSEEKKAIQNEEV